MLKVSAIFLPHVYPSLGNVRGCRDIRQLLRGAGGEINHGGGHNVPRRQIHVGRCALPHLEPQRLAGSALQGAEYGLEFLRQYDGG